MLSDEYATHSRSIAKIIVRATGARTGSISSEALFARASPERPVVPSSDRTAIAVLVVLMSTTTTPSFLYSAVAKYKETAYVTVMAIPIVRDSAPRRVALLMCLPREKLLGKIKHYADSVWAARPEIQVNTLPHLFV